MSIEVQQTRAPRALAVVLAVVVCALLAPSSALAWKPFAHNFTGDRAYADAVDNGSVTVGGHAYPVDPRIVDALRSWPAYYNAGVVGPDGFPDLVYGQSQIHPVHTGRWLRYIVAEAWAAQSDPRYSASQRAQILAFAYGFLTHAAGDMWAHTLINDFAGGVFPSFKEFVHPDKAKIAVRHIVAEGYSGNATPGWDRSQDEDDRAQVCTAPGPPGTNCDDVSDDQTHGIPFDAPHEFIYNTLVDPNVPLPVGTCADHADDDGDGVVDDGCPGGPFTVGKPEPQRGPLLDFFLDLEASVQLKAADYRFDANHTNCTTVDPDCYSDDRRIVVHTVRGDRTITVDATRCEARFFCVGDPIDAVGDLINGLVASYLEAWVDDIHDGLQHWSEFSLGVTKALFDPQARRDAQNDECHTRGPESSPLRASCESGVSAIDTVMFETNDYVNGHMLSMLGLPDAIGPIRDALDTLSDLLDEVLSPALNPFRLTIQELKDAVKDLIKDEVRKSTGVDVDEVKDFMSHPTRWMCGDAGVSISLPGVGTITGAGLFSSSEHARLDDIMGLGADHHETGSTVSTDCSPLAEDSQYDPSRFAPIKDTITQAKLLLLDNTQLDRALGRVLQDDGVIRSESAVRTYGSGDNVMFTPLSASAPWLELIDGDHAWREDGLPRFCNNATACTGLPSDLASYPRQPTPRDTDPDSGALLNGGNGRYPLWESCVLRPAFRSLFTDWENAANPTRTNFPDLGDPTSADPASDPNPPAPLPLATTGPTYTSGSTTFVGGGARFTIGAHDDVFTDDHVSVAWRAYRQGATPGGFTPVANGASVGLPAGASDGVWIIEVRAEDPCGSDTRSRSVTLDTTGPAITIDSPAPEGVIFATDELNRIHYAVDDGAGSGVRESSVRLDGAGATNGQTLDMFLLAPGVHTVEVRAADNLGNPSTAPRHFEVHATAASLLSNIDRACREGAITKQGTCSSLQAKLRSAQRAHERGQHDTEGNILGAFVNELQAQRGKSVEAATADRMIAFAQDLIARGG